MTHKRKHIRFKADPMWTAQLDLTNRTSGAFSPAYQALILDEAPLGGCGLLAFDLPELKIGDIVVVKLGELRPFTSEVKWLVTLDPKILKIGLEFLE